MENLHPRPFRKASETITPLRVANIKYELEAEIVSLGWGMGQPTIRIGRRECPKIGETARCDRGC